MKRMMMWLKAKRKDQKGQTMVEYALLVVLIGLVVAGAIPTVTDAIGGAYDRISTELGPAPQ